MGTMSRGRWTVWLAVAWTAPLAWLVLLPFIAVSDGAVISSPTAVLTEGRWGESLLVLETYGDTPLRAGDRILAVEGRPVAELVTARDADGADAAQGLSYRVRRPEGGLDVVREGDARLTRHP